ncbi:chromobox protein homolog 1-like [Styela clava]
MGKKTAKPQEEVPTPIEEEEEEEVYEVEKVLDKRLVRGKTQYLIKWKGFSLEDNTWEPQDNLDCPDLIAEYETKSAKKEKPSQKSDEKKRKHSQAQSEKSESKKSKTENDEVRPHGFARGLKPEKIIGATDSSGQLMFLMKWESSDEADLVPAKEANVNCPQIVIGFYEERLTWHTNPSDEAQT